MKGWETPTTLCTPEQRQDGCLDKDEWDKYIQGL